MKRSFSYSAGSLLLMLLSISAAQAQIEGVRIVFMEPEGANEKGQPAGFRSVSDSERIKMYTGWMNNEAARMAMDLYKRSWRIAQTSESTPVYYIALVPGGNHADLGFRLQTGSGWESHERTAYIKLAPEDWVFDSTQFHETGHVILSMLNGGKAIPNRNIASVPHTTAALTDRGTAFDEGFAIHLETIAAHIGGDNVLKDRYDHSRFLFGAASQRRSEYYRQSLDLLSFSQSRARYYDVRENVFAFAPAFKGPDYLRVQLEKSRDFATLRDANQLLQSEGFYATFFFSVLVRGVKPPTAELVRERQEQMLATLAEMFRSQPLQPDSPYLLHFVEAFLRKYPSEASEIVDVLLDLSHGVFVDQNAGTLWREHYLGALRLDLAERDNQAITKARAEWRTKVIGNPKVLYSNLGPQIRCEVPSMSVKLVAFGEAAPLSFDLNTVEEGVMRMIPGVTDSQVTMWLAQRRQRSFSDANDFKKRSGLSEKILTTLSF